MQFETSSEASDVAAGTADHPAGDVATRRRPRLWAVGGGKGGVGKSVVSSSLGVEFAIRGRRCVLVDADLGAPNLHTMLGVEKPECTLSHFLNREVASLDEVVARTPVPGLGLVSGDEALVGMANPSHGRKLKFMRHLSQIEADDVILDLGAGTSFNILDFFVAADRGLVVMAPEPTSIGNSYQFLKAAFIRSLRTVAREERVRAAIEEVLGTRNGHRLVSPLDMISSVSQVDSEAGRQLAERARGFSPLLIMNSVRSDEDRTLVTGIARACRDFLGTQTQQIGVLDWDEYVIRAVRARRPVLTLSSTCPFWAGIEAVADRLLADELPREAPKAGNGLPPVDLNLPGGYLKLCRERLGLSIAEAQRRTCIRAIDAIESERFDRLPEETYVRGLVDLYANTLGVSQVEALVESYLRRYRRARRWSERPPPKRPRSGEIHRAVSSRDSVLARLSGGG